MLFRRTHTKLICDVSELTALIHGASRLDDLLSRMTKMIAEHMACEVCSVYLYEPSSDELVLKATYGLKPQAVDHVRLGVGEGLTGVAFKEKRAICEGHADRHPQFRYFPEIGEEKFDSLLAVPIIRGSNDIGVIVVQSIKRDYFNEEDVQVFRAITAQLASTIETARLLLQVKDNKDRPKVSRQDELPRFIKGQAGCEGVAFGPAAILDEDLTDLSSFIEPNQDHLGKDAFENALRVTEAKIEELQEQMAEDLYDVAGLIFSAQIMMLKDQQFIDEVNQMIASGQNAVIAVSQVVERFAKQLSSIQDEYLRERANDIRDVGRRLLEQLTGKTVHALSHEGKIIIAKELFPSDALKLYSQRIKGIVMLSGGVTGHVAILARSLNLPLVLTQEMGLLSLPPETLLLVDGVMGYVYVDPDEMTHKQIAAREEVNKDIDTLKTYVQHPPISQDGIAMTLMANINLLGDLKAATAFGAQGVGLYRSEFPFMIRNAFPTEEEQVLIYRRLLDGMKGLPVTMRTLDIGGDKLLSYFDYGKEDNPFLGLRSLRFSLTHPDIFMAQLSAMLRAGHGHTLKILFPMVASLDEFLQAKGLVQECIHRLSQKGVAINEHPSFGVMVELPSIIEVIDEIAAEADFLALGTNDLVQYMLAVDRTNEKVASFYMPYHPAVLRAMKRVVDAAKEHGKSLCVCGDMARDKRGMLILMGLGIRILSMDGRYLPMAHQYVRQCDIGQAQRMVDLLLKQSQISRVQQILDESCSK